MESVYILVYFGHYFPTALDLGSAEVKRKYLFGSSTSILAPLAARKVCFLLCLLFALYWPLQVIANPRALKTLPTPSIPFLRNRAPTIPK